MPENLKNQSEKLEPPVEADIILARHAHYHDVAWESERRADGAAESEIKAGIGHLTAEGITEARQLGADILEKALSYGHPVDIAFLASQQPYDSPEYSNVDWAGKRAEETAFVAMDAVLDGMRTRGISHDQVRLATPMPSVEFGQFGTPDKLSVERDVYWSAISETSLASEYKKRAKALIAAEQQTGQPVTGGYQTVSKNSTETDSQNISNREKELWARGDHDLDELGQAINNETSADVAERVRHLFKDIQDLAEQEQQNYPDRRLLVVVISHDAVMGAVTKQMFGLKDPILPAYAENITINLKGNEVTLRRDGKDYETKISG
jgi:broad specificity phosphatase PhoE